MPVKNLKSAYVRVSVETQEQLAAAVEIPGIDLIYLDAGLFSPESWREAAARIHKGSGGFGKLAVLRLPQIWRSRTERFFSEKGQAWNTSGFDAYLAGNTEEILWLKENGIPDEQILSDHSVYSFNEESEDALRELTGIGTLSQTYSTELNEKELKALAARLKRKDPDIRRELIVYGRVPLMVSAQCLRKTSIGCDRRCSLLWMKDRTGALMPVKNRCPFCISTIYNSVPTVLFDLEDDIRAIGPDFIRYEFTTESGKQVRDILSGNVPGQFTRGHFKRGVL